MSIKLKVPDSAMIKRDGGVMLPCGEINFMRAPDGTVEAPRWAVPELIARGCSRVDGKKETIDVRAELASGALEHELRSYLNSKGARDHRIVKRTHPWSADQRAKGNTVVADELDRLTHVAYRGQQIRRLMTLDDLRRAALALFDGSAKVSAGEALDAQGNHFFSEPIAIPTPTESPK